MHRFVPRTPSPRTLVLALVLLVAHAIPGISQESGEQSTARPEDVASIDAITKAVYDAISGPAGQPRDWARFRSLFVEGARLIPTGRAAQDGPIVARVFSVDEYIARATPALERGFFEQEIGRIQERYGNIVHFMSAYESRRAAEDPTPFARGVNSFQLLFDGTRWWVVTIYWQSETPDTPIPERMVHKP